jgi:hypothetical protein
MPPIDSRSYTKEEEQFLKNIGFKIQFFRKQRDLSQNELAEKSGLSYKVTSGRRTILLNIGICDDRPILRQYLMMLIHEYEIEKGVHFNLYQFGSGEDLFDRIAKASLKGSHRAPLKLACHWRNL